MQRYNYNKNKYIDEIKQSTILSSRENLEKWYDKFTEYSSMGFLSCKQYWKSLFSLGYKFAKFTISDIHICMFQYFCLQDSKMSIHQYMISIISLRNEMPILINRDDMLEMIFKNIQLNMFKQLQISYIAILNNIEFSITPDIFYEIVREIKEDGSYYKEYVSIFFQLFYFS